MRDMKRLCSKGEMRVLPFRCEAWALLFRRA